MTAPSLPTPSLPALARAAIAREFGETLPVPPLSAAMRHPAATFVTLTQQGELRGCIGTLEAWRPLIDDLESNARAAAFSDPRFPPLRAEELPQTRVEVSVLTPPEPLHFSSEADALAQLHPGEEGVILSEGGHRATFLPQVWTQLPAPENFMAHLKRKAGLPADYWSNNIKLWIYHVEKHDE